MENLTISVLLLSFYQISFSFIIHSNGLRRASSTVSMLNKDILKHIEEDISKTTNQPFKIKYPPISGTAGGSGASTYLLYDENNPKLGYFMKYGSQTSYNMLKAEFIGVNDMYNTNTIRVPKPITCGIVDYNSYLILEKLPFGGFGNAEELGRQLAKLHRCTSPNNMYGYSINNTIGATPQLNTWTSSWSEFWDTYRLGYILDLSKHDGAVFHNEVELRNKVKYILDQHICVPSLVHGDLWSGNQGYLLSGEPVIFDPATYYGDREVDIAMTKLFGANSNKFYKAYNDEWPLPPHYEIRETIYNLYHILNHFVLFGGGYLSQAQSMIGKIIKYNDI